MNINLAVSSYIGVSRSYSKRWWLCGRKVDGTDSEPFSIAGFGVIIVG